MRRERRESFEEERVRGEASCGEATDDPRRICCAALGGTTGDADADGSLE